MPWGLKRYYGTGSLHFITWSCYRRQPLLSSAARRDLLLTVLEKMRNRYRFAVIGYVVMPEHIHLLVSEPQVANPSTVVQAVKLGFSRRLTGAPGRSSSHLAEPLLRFQPLESAQRDRKVEIYASESRCAWAR